MGNRVVPLSGCWLDARYRKAFNKLSGQEQKARLRELEELLKQLATCRHPTSDPALSRWRPSAYKSLAAPLSGRYIEYRLKGVARVVVCFFEEPPAGYDQPVMLLCAATLQHDHDRMMAILKANRDAIGAPGEWEAADADDSG